MVATHTAPKKRRNESDKLRQAKEKYVALCVSLASSDRKLFCAYVESKSADMLEAGDVGMFSPGGRVQVGAKSGRRSFWADVMDRFSLLATLMVFQSLSSFILSSFQSFIEVGG
jgi:hypothetical protein